MINKKSVESIREAVEFEINAAIENHGAFHSQHEAWAVLKEECEEMVSTVNRGIVQNMLYTLWLDVKIDKSADDMKLQEIYDVAKSCAYEAVQVMAMVEKWRVCDECKDEESGFRDDEATSGDQDRVPESF